MDNPFHSVYKCWLEARTLIRDKSRDRIVDKLAVARPARPEDERMFTTHRGAKAIVRRGAPGRWRDGLTKCLYLESHDGKSFHWVFEPQRSGKRFYFGYGGYPAVPVAEAREKVAQDRIVIRQGKHPGEERKAVQEATARAQMTLSMVYDEWFAWKLPTMRTTTAAGYRNPFLANERCRQIGAKPINEFNTDDAYAFLVARFGTKLTPILQEVRARLGRCVDYAVGRRWREPGKLNPFTWRANLEVLFSPSTYVRKGRRPFGYAKLPAFMKSLRANPSLYSLALEILILSGSRSGTVRKARWSEVDLENLIWTRPPENMKQGRNNLHDHAVHISPRMAEIFRFLQSIRAGSELIFPSRKDGAILSQTCWDDLLPKDVDAHGLRTDLENWRQEQTDFATDVGAVQLDHVIRSAENDLIAANSTVRAYARSPLFNKRKLMVDAWDAFLTDPAEIPPDLAEHWRTTTVDPEEVKARRRAYIRGYMQRRRAEPGWEEYPETKGPRGRPRKVAAGEEPAP